MDIRTLAVWAALSLVFGPITASIVVLTSKRTAKIKMTHDDNG